MPSVPSVTMKGSMRPRVMSRPCARPKTAPSSSANAMPSITATIVESPDAPRLFIKRMTHPAISAAIEPTERSMPPEMMTKHMPTAMMPINAVRVSTFMALSKVAKSGLSSVPATHSSARPATGPIPCRRAAHDRTAAAPAAPGVGALVVSGCGVGGVFGGSRCIVCSCCKRNQCLFAQVFGIERGLQATRPHHGDAVAQADQFNQLGRDDNYTAPFVRDLLDQEIDVPLRANVHPASGFVQHHHARIGMQHLSQCQLLLIAAGQRRGANVQRTRADAEC